MCWEGAIAGTRKIVKRGKLLFWQKWTKKILRRYGIFIQISKCRQKSVGGEGTTTKRIAEETESDVEMDENSWETQ